MSHITKHTTLANELEVERRRLDREVELQRQRIDREVELQRRRIDREVELQREQMDRVVAWRGETARREEIERRDEAWFADPEMEYYASTPQERHRRLNEAWQREKERQVERERQVASREVEKEEKSDADCTNSDDYSTDSVSTPDYLREFNEQWDAAEEAYEESQRRKSLERQDDAERETSAEYEQRRPKQYSFDPLDEGYAELIIREYEEEVANARELEDQEMAEAFLCY